MSKFCASCGASLQDEAFCPQCGAAVTNSAETTPMTVPATPAPAATLNGAAEEAKPLSLWAYLGLIVLFSLPCIGLIAAIILSFIPKNKAVNNFARAAVIWLVVLAILAGIAVSILAALVTAALDAAVHAIEEFAETNGVVYDDGSEIDLNALFDALEAELEKNGISINGSISIGEDGVSFAA